MKDYIEVYTLEEELIARLDLSNNKLNIQFVFDEFGYCPYCFNGIMDFNEDEVDCVYSGDSCRIC